MTGLSRRSHRTRRRFLLLALTVTACAALGTAWPFLGPRPSAEPGILARAGLEACADRLDAVMRAAREPEPSAEVARRRARWALVAECRERRLRLRQPGSARASAPWPPASG